VLFWRCTRHLARVAWVLGLASALTWLNCAPSVAWVAPYPGSAVPVAGAAGPAIKVAAGELVNADTGAPLWAQNLTSRRPMGSITKVMTALVVLRAGGLTDRIEVTRAAIRYVHKDGASSAGLIRGDILTVRQLLEAMLLPSGCDAAYLLANAYGPGPAAFIAQMNATAAAIGMTSTHFTSFDGMPYPTEDSTYSSAPDLIRLGEVAMQYPVFREIVGQQRFYLPADSDHHSYLWYQTNVLIGTYQGALGIKTGDTDAAGNCLLFEARRNGQTLIGVVLHASPASNPGSAIVAGRRLLNWGFSQPLRAGGSRVPAL
jgi:serine-type D-Ala-D-Ala carboxypeptidase (penicillin-binding protein 5/6)